MSNQGNQGQGLAAALWGSGIQIQRDEVAEKLDEMADLCEYWKKHRERGRTPEAIRAALLAVARECVAIFDVEKMRP